MILEFDNWRDYNIGDYLSVDFGDRIVYGQVYDMVRISVFVPIYHYHLRVKEVRLIEGADKKLPIIEKG